MHKKRPLVARAGAAGVILLATTLVGCSTTPGPGPGADGGPTPSSTASASGSTDGGTAAPVVLKSNVKDEKKGVEVDTVVRVNAEAGTLSKVSLWTKSKKDDSRVAIKGSLSPDGLAWTANSGLDPASKYRLEMEGKSAADQSVVKKKSSFTTQKLSLDEQTDPSIQPKTGSTVGVGMPVMLTFDIGVKDKKEFEKHLVVTSTPRQVGTWRWFGDKTVHYRPKTYWEPGTKVVVKANLNGVKAGNGIYGQQSTSTSFKVGKSVVTKINLKTHQAKVYINGKLTRKIPISGGKSGWSSRSGTKLIMQKLEVTRMTNEAIGASEEYDFRVPYAMRVTISGEFLHAAPWKEGKGHFGVRNSSHGCIGMSTKNARWLFGKVLIGSPVVTTGSNRGLEEWNGWTDWDMSYKKYQEGSAL